MSTSVTYTPGYGYAGYLPGFDRPMVRYGKEFIESMKELATQNLANKRDAVLPPNAPATYDPMESFTRRELTDSEFDKLTAELAAKYDPTNMTQEEYDSLLDDLVKEKILSRNELGPLGYHGFAVVGSLAEGGTGVSGGTYLLDPAAVHNDPSLRRYESIYGSTLGLSQTDGNAYAYAKLMALMTPDSGITAGWLTFAEKKQNSFQVLADILEAIQKKS